MKNAHRLTGIFAFLGILVLILDGKTALIGAQEGIDLCIRTVVPSLFPFFLLSILLTGTVSHNSLSILRPVIRLFSMPEGTQSIWISGFLGGYPAGAQAIALAYQSGQLKKADADRLLSFCSNAGPAFLFGMVAPMFSNPAAAFLLWGIHIASALFVSALIPASQSGNVSGTSHISISFSAAMHTAVRIMACVCGWIIVFRVFLTFLDRWFLWIVSPAFRCALYGALELSNGCCALSSIANPRLCFILCSGMLAWGGLCVVLQTLSVTEGLSLKAYLKGKLLQTVFSLVLSSAFVLNIWFPVIVLLLILVFLVQKTQNRGGNPAAVGV